MTLCRVLVLYAVWQLTMLMFHWQVDELRQLDLMQQALDMHITRNDGICALMGITIWFRVMLRLGASGLVW